MRRRRDLDRKTIMSSSSTGNSTLFPAPCQAPSRTRERARKGHTWQLQALADRRAMRPVPAPEMPCPRAS